MWSARNWWSTAESRKSKNLRRLIRNSITKGATPIMGVIKPQHADGLIRAGKLTLSANEIAQLEALADAVGVNTRGWWVKVM